MESKELQEPVKGFNLSVDNVKMQIIATINESGLPISIIKYILQDLFMETSKLYEETVDKEYEDFSIKSREYIKAKEEQKQEDDNTTVEEATEEE